MSAIKPIHQSLTKSRNKQPKDMQIMSLPTEVRMTIEQTAIDIFADMTNAGCTMQQALAAIYLSGLQHGAEMSKEAA